MVLSFLFLLAFRVEFMRIMEAVAGDRKTKQRLDEHQSWSLTAWVPAVSEVLKPNTLWKVTPSLCPPVFSSMKWDYTRVLSCWHEDLLS